MDAVFYLKEISGGLILGVPIGLLIGYVIGGYLFSERLRKYQRLAEEHPADGCNPDSISDWQWWQNICYDDRESKPKKETQDNRYGRRVLGKWIYPEDLKEKEEPET
tara:strand:+ start:262 stop:582 length:321 start_codon:yes stop_codon:yes gene_type:complete